MHKQRIKLMTDSCSDIGKELAEQLGIHLNYVSIFVDGKEYREEMDFSKEEFYRMAECAEEFPSSSQITPYEIREDYEAFAAEGYTDVVHITIGAGGAGTYANAEQARRQFYAEHAGEAEHMKIHLVDGRNYTATYGYAVVEAAKKLKRGADVAELLDYLEDWVRHAGLYFVPMTLKYVKRSGRVSAAAAFAGELLGLKPLCRIVNCHSEVLQKIRGENGIVPRVAQVVQEEMQPHTPYLILYGTNRVRAEALAAVLTKELGYPPEDFWKIGAAIVCNAGPDVLGFVIRRPQETA